MNELIPVALGIAAFLLCVGGLVGASVALVRWSSQEQMKCRDAAVATGFEPVTKLDPALAGRLLALTQYDASSARVVCPWARREAGYTVILQGIEKDDDGPLAPWQLTPAVRAPGLAIPRMTLLPRSEIGERFTDWLGRVVAWRSKGVLRTVAFAEDPRFEQLFEVLGADEEAVRAFLDDRRRAALAGMAGCFVVVEGDLFTFDRYYRSGGPRGEEARLASYVANGYALLAIFWG